MFPIWILNNDSLEVTLHSWGAVDLVRANTEEGILYGEGLPLSKSLALSITWTGGDCVIDPLLELESRDRPEAAVPSEGSAGASPLLDLSGTSEEELGTSSLRSNRKDEPEEVSGLRWSLAAEGQLTLPCSSNWKGSNDEQEEEADEELNLTRRSSLSEVEGGGSFNAISVPPPVPASISAISRFVNADYRENNTINSYKIS